MDNVGVVERITVNFFGRPVVFSLNMLIMTWIVMAFIIIIAYFGTRKLNKVPGKLQSVLELFISTFRGLTYDVLPEKLAVKYTPLIATLFIFVLLANLLGILPPVFHFFYVVLDFFHVPGIAWLAKIPVFEEPTKFLSTTLGLGLMVFFVVHYEAIRHKGLWGYLKSYAEPMFLLAPINLIGELAKVVSHSFRLFGNILGGSIIVVIISSLLHFLILPPFLMAFFGLFSGAIQAFVFTMLAVTYIAVAID